MTQLYSQSSVHLMSTNPPLYSEFMKNYIYNRLNQTCQISSWLIDPSILYKNISYPTLSDSKDNLDVLLISAIDKADFSNNTVLIASINSWVKHTNNKQKYLDIVTLDFNIHIKYPRTDDENTQKRILFEYFIGTLMNKLRKKVPHFMYTLGMIKCFSSKIIPSPSNSMKQFCDIEKQTVKHIIQEKIKGRNLDEWLQKDPNPMAFYNIILQLTFALAKAQDKKGFIHNALYASNIILRSVDINFVVFQFGSQIYQMDTDKIIPTIIDFSSSRVTHKGFGLCYLSNPTVFVSGRDLCKLIISCLAKINTNKSFYSEVSWIGEFFHTIYDVSIGSYEELLVRYNNFNLPDDNPLVNLTPMDFINWFRSRAGEIFNKLVTIKSREIKDFHLQNLRDESEMEKNLQIIPSGILKSYALKEYGIKYISTEQEKEYDKKLFEKYTTDISYSNSVYVINYNFPLNRQYNRENKINYKQILPGLFSSYTLISNYLTLLRYSKTVSTTIPFNQDMDKIYDEKDKLKYNITMISNLCLYKLYQIAEYKNNNILNGQAIISYKDLYIATDWVKELYPICGSYIDSAFLPQIESISSFLSFDKIEKNYYYSPCTLKQFVHLSPHKKEVIKLITKILGRQNEKKIEQILSDGTDDMEILLNLRKFRPIEEKDFDRGKSRAKDLERMINILPANLTSYLDYGGGDGSISSSIAKLLKINKNRAYTADIEEWFSTSRTKRFENITYLTLKENQEVKLDSNSIDIITIYQVLHHIKNINFVLNELQRICKNILIIREHDCRSIYQRELIDLEHSIYEVCMEPNANIKFVNDYCAWYKPKEEWTKILKTHGFELIHSTEPVGVTRYYYGIYRRIC